MILLIDTGNTQTKFKLYSKEEFYMVKTSEINSLSFKSYINEVVDGAIISSVVKGASDILKRIIKEEYGIDALVVNTNLKSNVFYDKDMVNKLGTDMFSSLEGAMSLSHTFLSIDCGTATTFNLVIDGKYIGTTIAPGVYTAHNALFTNASLIDEISLDGDFNLLNRDTDTAVRAGTILGFTYLIDGFIDSIKDKYHLDNLDVYITGGASKYIHKHLKNSVTRIKDLIFRGLIRLYDLNK